MKISTGLLAVAAMLVIIVSLFTAIEWFWNGESSPKIFVGVEFAYGSINDCKELVDKVKYYTNLFVVGLPELTFNQAELNEICDYIYNAGLHFIIMFTNPQAYMYYHPYVWIKKAAEKYGEKFLGVYYYDEPGGKQLDGDRGRMVVEAENYTEAANIYVDYLRGHLEYYLYSGVKVFTSDYGLYWFDFKAGYDVVFAQFGWNHSRLLNIALCRGAAKVQRKEWGVIITWTFTHPPYLESGDELYNDLVLAYKAGAKYFVVFSYPNITRYGTLTEDHFEALENFWDYVQRNPKEHGVYNGDVGYVLPKDYGFGFRGPHDTIWGLWDGDSLAEIIWQDSWDLADEHQFKLDVIYYDDKFSNAIKNSYKKLFFCDETST
ncbi:MAG: hypothetical protein ACQXXG_00570 [Candidatus Bathyarchaeia archaeon]|nr:hypothetical protein [Candidatus Bathyarchaeota archaeon A05DMB-3]